MNKLIIFGLVVVVGAGVIYAVQSSPQAVEMTKVQPMDEKNMMETEKAEIGKTEMSDTTMVGGEMRKPEGAGAMMDDKSATAVDEVTVPMKKDEMMAEAVTMKTGSYEVYSADKLMLAEEGAVVLFFKASWCPSCRALDSDIKANLGNIKSGLTILEVNYDTETALKQKYGVTAQHTLVQVDKNGNQIAKWSGGGTLATLEAKVQ